MKQTKSKRKAVLKQLNEHLTEHEHTALDNKVILELISYDENYYDFKNNIAIDDLLEQCNLTRINWINVDGLSDGDLIKKISKKFDLHYLLLEDIQNTDHQPKADEYENHLFFTLKMLYRIDGQNNIDYEHISFVLGKN